MFEHHGIGKKYVRGQAAEAETKEVTRGQVTWLLRSYFTFTQSEKGVIGGLNSDATSPDMFY